MPYIQVTDAPAPRYIVTVVHSEYGENSVSLFIDEQAARAEANKWTANGAEVYLGELLPTVPIQADRKAWHGCCVASNRIADLVCAMFYPGDVQARKTWPTATWSEMIASELNITVPED
jgi:hypothetical protein